MNLTEQKERNETAREGIELINKNLGIKIKYLGFVLQLNTSSFSQWRMGLYDFGKERLVKVENLLAKYNNL